MDVAGRIALVTGGSSGIGKPAALLLAKKGAKVGVLGRNKYETQQTVKLIQKNGGEALALIADVAKPAQMERAIQKVIDAWERLDIVFANAGINGVWAPLEDLEPEEWDETLGVNLKGTFLTVKYAVPYLKRQGGSIIITSSVNGTRMFSNTGATAYARSKAAQVAFAKMVALELAKHRIRVNVICPGAIETSIDENTRKKNVGQEKEPVHFPEGEIPLTEGQPGTSEQVAEAVLFLASDASSHITGSELWIDGGQSLLQG